MHWQQWAIIVSLCVALGGVVSLGIYLALTRDKGVRASGQRPAARGRPATLEQWRHAGEAARRYIEAANDQLAACRHGYPALAGGACAADKVAATNLVQHQPIDELRVAALTHQLIERSIRNVYAEIEARQVRELAQTAWATWQA